jgi:hypothetical protein
MQRRGRRVTEATLRGVLLIGAVAGAWAVCNAIEADVAYANDKPCPSVIGELLGTAGVVVDTVLPPSLSSSDQQTTTWKMEPARSDDARSAEAEKATVAEPGQRASQPRPTRTAPSVRATESWTLSTSVRGAVGESTGGVVTPVAKLVEPVTRPVVDAVHLTLDPVLVAARPMVGPLVDAVLPAVEPVAIEPGPDLEVRGAIPLDAGPRPVPTSGQAPAPAGVHQASDLGGPGRWRAGGDRPGDAAVGEHAGAGGPAPIGAGSSVPRPRGSTTSVDASGAGAGVVADIAARSWAPEPGTGASHSPLRGKLAGRWPVPGVRPV